MNTLVVINGMTARRANVIAHRTGTAAMAAPVDAILVVFLISLFV